VRVPFPTPGPPVLPEQRRHGVIGYTAGVFDMFHAGHLHLLKQARARCDYLVVAVTTDELALEGKGSAPVVPLLERMAIVQSMRYVDHVVPQLSPDKAAAWRTFGFDVLFVGDNVRDAPQWQRNAEEMAGLGVRLEFLPATYARSGELLERGLADLVAE
jgi:glycerol-3-phosphate cytidylyltransferase